MNPCSSSLRTRVPEGIAARATARPRTREPEGSGVLCSAALATPTFQPEHVMIKVTVLYPNAPDAKFDMKYYVTHHMPMVRDKCAPECRSIAAEGGLAGRGPGAPAPGTPAAR